MEARAPFPSNPEDFAEDPRIAYSKEDATYILEDESGEWEWLPGPSRWSKMTDEAEIQRQAEAYKMQGVDEDAPALNPAKKRKEALDTLENSSKSAKTAPGATASTKPKQPKPNTAIYVTGIPADAHLDEIKTLFSRCGAIQESVESDEKRIKMYYDREGKFKGEALIIFLSPTSVTMAINLYDESPFVRDDPKDPTSTIRVVEADRSFKATKDDDEAEEASEKTRAKFKSKPTKAQIKSKQEEMYRRINDWSDDEPSTISQTSSRWDKVVVIKNAFTLKDLSEDPTYIEDLRDDMTEAAEKHGKDVYVTVYDLEEEGVVTIRFKNAMAAKACAEQLDGKGYSGRKLKTSIATGREWFKKSREAVDKVAEEAERLEEYSNFIEGKSEKGEDNDKAHGAANGAAKGKSE
ncbi:related to cold sensitive U2 snRNA supressor [Lecanosticta acicola]|uniref:Related to cold sensitive U2 snRNA supressor n=1 Tax=Lecanosticta acicola TaxID=111012 RepID=A0AAI8Z2E6_9PEZI|nr:related to cold sensitive U2 snRNA supressor [Lecanosticta acicola]